MITDSRVDFHSLHTSSSTALPSSHSVQKVMWSVLPDVRLKPDLYGFQSVKMVYGRNLGHTPKTYGFLVIIVNCLILIIKKKKNSA